MVKSERYAAAGSSALVVLMNMGHPLCGIMLALPTAVLVWAAILIPASLVIRGHHLGSARIIAMRIEQELYVQPFL